MTTARSLIIVLFIVLATLQYQLWFAHSGIMKTLQLKHEIGGQVDHNQNQEKINTELVSQITILHDGKASVEDLARNGLGMIKSNEKFYRFVS